MIIARIKQGLTYIFIRYNQKNNLIVREILTDEEFKIFNEMSEYDKIHSFYLFKLVKENATLKDNINYLKLALLHDCGKENLSLLVRVKKVLIGDKKVENHPNLSYEKLKNINNTVGELALSHHLAPISNEMKIFQKLDDK